jgi:hypothetical protein
VATVGVEWINNFPPPCDFNELSYCDETSVGFANAMRNRGHTVAFNWGDGSAWERDFRDPAFGGSDTSWSDSVDFVHFSAHGSCGTDNVFRGYFGSQVDSCTWRSDRARFGNTNLEYLIIDACQSLELSRDIIAVWHNAFYGLHMVFGFNRFVSDSWWTGGRGYDFGWRVGGGDRLSASWLDECYAGWPFDDNPVVMVAGRDYWDANYRLNYETIYSNFGDVPHNEIGWYVWRWRD